MHRKELDNFDYLMNNNFPKFFYTMEVIVDWPRGLIIATKPNCNASLFATK